MKQIVEFLITGDNFGERYDNYYDAMTRFQELRNQKDVELAFVVEPNLYCGFLKSVGGKVKSVILADDLATLFANVNTSVDVKSYQEIHPDYTVHTLEGSPILKVVIDGTWLHVFFDIYGMLTWY